MAPHVGVVGLELMGTTHTKRLRNFGATVAGADIDASARRTFTTEFEVPVFEDHVSLIDSDVDAFVVTVPNALHETVAVAALERDVPVLVEKPLAHTAESAERLVAAARRSAAFCMVGFMVRYYDSVEAVSSKCAAGEYGDIQHIEATYVRRDGIPNRGWFRDQDLTVGGAVVDIGVHVLDLALLDFPDIEGVYGRTRSERAALDVEDSATGLVRTDDGATITLETAWAANRDAHRGVVLRGDEGGVTLDLAGKTLTVYDGSGAEPTVVDTGESTWLTPEIKAFVNAVESGVRPSTSALEEALAVQRVIGAL